MTEKYIFPYLMFKPGKIYDYKSVSFPEKKGVRENKRERETRENL